jgi:hypothetical protein
MSISSRAPLRAFFASSRPSSWPLACKPKRHPRWRRALLARARAMSVSSLNERLVCEPLSCRALHKAIEPRQGVVLDVALIQPERKFVNVAGSKCFGLT